MDNPLLKGENRTVHEIEGSIRTCYYFIEEKTKDGWLRYSMHYLTEKEANDHLDNIKQLSKLNLIEREFQIIEVSEKVIGGFVSRHREF